MNINLKSFALGASLMLGLLGVYALAASIPNIFAAGDVISAAKMNANFAALTAEINALKSKNLEFETFKNAAPNAKGTVRALASIAVNGTVFKQYSSVGGNITVTKSATAAGAYSVVLPGVGFNLAEDTVLVTPVNSTRVVCSATELSNQNGIFVECFNFVDATPANTNFNFAVFNR